MITSAPSDAQPVAWRWRVELGPWHVVSSEHEARGAYEVEPLYPQFAIDAKDALLKEAADVIDRLLHLNTPFSASAIEENVAVVGHARSLLPKLTEATK